MKKVMYVQRRKIKRSIFLIVCIVLTIAPIFFIVTNSLMDSTELTSRYSSQVLSINVEDLSSKDFHFVNIGFIPKKLSFEQYIKLFSEHQYLMKNYLISVAVVTCVIMGQYIIAPITAYAFEYSSFKYKEYIYFFYIIILLMPIQLLLVPNFIVAQWMSINDSYLAIILPAIFHPLGVFLIRQQLKNYPKDVIDAARLDGAGELTILYKLCKPHITTTLAALSVIFFSDYWNIVEQVIIFIKTPEDRPMSVLLNQISNTQPDIFFAAATIFMLPGIVIFLMNGNTLSKESNISK